MITTGGQAGYLGYYDHSSGDFEIVGWAGYGSAIFEAGRHDGEWHVMGIGIGQFGGSGGSGGGSPAPSPPSEPTPDASQSYGQKSSNPGFLSTPTAPESILNPAAVDLGNILILSEINPVAATIHTGDLGGTSDIFHASGPSLYDMLAPIGKGAITKIGDLTSRSYPLARATAKMGGAALSGITLGTDAVQFYQPKPGYMRFRDFGLLVSSGISLAANFAPPYYRPLRWTSSIMHGWDLATQNMAENIYGYMYRRRQ